VLSTILGVPKFRYWSTHASSLSLAQQIINVNILQIILLVLMALCIERNAIALDSNPSLISTGVHAPCSALVITATDEAGAVEVNNQFRPEARRRLLDRAKMAADMGDQKLAVDLSFQAYCLAVQNNETAPEIAEIASIAIENALSFGQLDTSSEIFEDAFPIVREHLPKNDPQRLRFDMAEARILSFRDRNEDSLALRIDLQPKLVTVFGKYSKESTINRVRIANTKLEMGHATDALADLRILQDDLKVSGTMDVQSNILMMEALTAALTLLGREGEALELVRTTRRELAMSVGEEDERVLSLDQSTSEILIRLNRPEEALEIAAKVFLSRYGQAFIGDPKALRALWDIAYLYVDNARLDSARLLLNFLIKETQSHPERVTRLFYFQTLSLIANLDLSQGNILAARDKWRTVYQGLLEIYGPDSEDTQIEAMNLAATYRMTGSVPEACKLLAETESSLAKTRAADIWALEFVRISHQSCVLEGGIPDNADLALESMRSSWKVISEHEDPTSRDALNALGSYANATLRLGHRSEAKNLLNQFAHLAEASRSSASEGSITRTSAFSSWISSNAGSDGPISGYRHLALLHAQDAELEQALRISELARDRTLQDRFAEQEWRRTQLPVYARSQLDKLLDRTQDLDERIAVEPDILERIRLESERTLVVAERGRTERALREQLHIAPPSFDPPTLNELRTRLANDAALISVLHSGDSWWALVISHNEPTRFIEFPDPDLGRNAAAWVRLLRGEPVRAWPLAGDRLALDAVRPEGAIGPYLTSDDLARRLSDHLLVPLKDAIRKARHLVFVGDDELVGIPLQALPLDTGLAVDRFEISYAPSLATYARWQQNAGARAHARDLLAVGAVDYEPIAPPATNDPIAVGVQIAEDHPLPFAKAELDAIAAQFPSARTSTWTRARANKAALRSASRSGELRRYRYVHIAAHAWAQPDQPESSAIVLAGNNDDLPTRRALTAAELAGLQMGSELIVLSACDTGVGHFEHGQGLLGLAYAGLAAGNRAEILSLWSIADDTTAKFMEHLYKNLRHGLNPVSALAATQREFRRSDDPRLSDPLVWAPFIVYGGY